MAQGNWKTTSFECPKCLTQIHIVTSLPDSFSPFRIACPCAYADMHRYRNWTEVPENEIQWEDLKRRWEHIDSFPHAIPFMPVESIGCICIPGHPTNPNCREPGCIAEIQKTQK